VKTGEHDGEHDYEEEEDVEVIKNDGDFSTNSNTTTTTSTTGEVEPQVQQSLLPHEALAPKEEQLLHDEEEDEPSSVATTYGTSSLSEQQQEPEPELEHNPTEAHPELFDNKENIELESHSQLNPNAVEFVPHFGSPPTSPSHIAIVDPLQTLGRQLLADDLVAESPRKGTRDYNMDLPLPMKVNLMMRPPSVHTNWSKKTTLSQTTLTFRMSSCSCKMAAVSFNRNRNRSSRSSSSVLIMVRRPVLTWKQIWNRSRSHKQSKS